MPVALVTSIWIFLLLTMIFQNLSDWITSFLLVTARLRETFYAAGPYTDQLEDLTPFGPSFGVLVCALDSNSVAHPRHALRSLAAFTNSTNGTRRAASCQHASSQHWHGCSRVDLPLPLVLIGIGARRHANRLESGRASRRHPRHPGLAYRNDRAALALHYTQ